MSDFVKKVKNMVGRAPTSIVDKNDRDYYDDSKYANINDFENGKIPEPKSALQKFWHGEGKSKRVTISTSDLYGGRENYDDEQFPSLRDDMNIRKKRIDVESQLRKKKTTTKPKRKIVKKKKGCGCK